MDDKLCRLRAALRAAERALEDARGLLDEIGQVVAVSAAPVAPGDLLLPEDAAARLKASVATLARWRGDGTGPLYIKRRGRVFYRRADIEAYEAGATRKRTRG